jgi:hypothetical protein
VRPPLIKPGQHCEPPRHTRYDTSTRAHEVQLLSPDGTRLEYVAGLCSYREVYDIIQSFDAGTQFCVPVVYAEMLQQTI